MSPAKTKGPYSGKDEQALMTELWSPEYTNNPYAFVMFVYPWGQPNTPLERFEGPRTWQKELLLEMAEHIDSNLLKMEMGEEPEVFQASIASGRGIGKSTLVAWLNHWMMSCQIGSTSITTANTEGQLKSKTWAEMGKWVTMGMNAHWFDKGSLYLRPDGWFEEALKKQLKVDTGYYYAQGQLWAEDNPDAFAGAHNMNGVMLIYDEASGIPKPIWSVSEGFFTEPILHRYWLNFSNPRRNTGAFFECFHKDRKYWVTKNIDSRTVEGTDKRVLNGIIEKHGEDSDEARIEVKGEFPRQGDRQFISREVIRSAVTREDIIDPNAALMMGVDPARYGDDSTVIRFRQGRNARVHPPIVLKHADNMKVANICAELINKLEPDGVCIDAGSGTGIIDRLREMGFTVHEIWFGAKPDDEAYADTRTWMWSLLRDWLGGACIDNTPSLMDDLAGPEYEFVGGAEKIKLESKEKMKKRGLASPDHADALGLTLVKKVARRDVKLHRKKSGQIAKGVDFPLFG